MPPRDQTEGAHFRGSCGGVDRGGVHEVFDGDPWGRTETLNVHDFIVQAWGLFSVEIWSSSSPAATVGGSSTCALTERTTSVSATAWGTLPRHRMLCRQRPCTDSQASTEPNGVTGATLEGSSARRASLGPCSQCADGTGEEPTKCRVCHRQLHSLTDGEVVPTLGESLASMRVPRILPRHPTLRPPETSRV